MTGTAVRIQRRNTAAMNSPTNESKHKAGVRARRCVRRSIALERKSWMIRVQAGIPVVQIEFQFSKQAEVRAIRYYAVDKTAYAVCPNCGYAMEREYQEYCEVCGQWLAWNKFNRRELKVERIHGSQLKEKGIIRR